jgi:hypothetical protein
MKKKETFAQRGFAYTRNSKCEQLLAESGKYEYTQSAKHSVVPCMPKRVPVLSIDPTNPYLCLSYALPR